MKLRFYQVDAFTAHLFAGNPAGVVLLEQELPDRTLQAIAVENNLPSTAFLRRRGEANRLRWFTPSAEADLCGHATLATAHVLFEEQGHAGELVSFESRNGTLKVRRGNGLLTMDFPAWPPRPTSAPPGLGEALGAEPGEVLAARHLMAVFDSEEQVAAVHPRMDRLAALDVLAVIATAPGRQVDFVSRFFAPRLGLPEDPVTGSAHCTLAPYWAGRLRKQVLNARQVSARGGELICEYRGERVLISGRAVVYLRGEISAG